MLYSLHVVNMVNEDVTPTPASVNKLEITGSVLKLENTHHLVPFVGVNVYEMTTWGGREGARPLSLKLLA